LAPHPSGKKTLALPEDKQIFVDSREPRSILRPATAASPSIAGAGARITFGLTLPANFLAPYMPTVTQRE